MSNKMEFKKIYDNVVNGGYDFGTGAWAVINNNIGMKLNNIGEYHPYVINKETSFSDDEIIKLKETCLSLSDENEDDVSKSLFSNVSQIKYDQRLGYYSGLYIGHVLEGDYRKNGSSGGFGTWLFSQLLKKNKIDYVINVVESDGEELFKYGISKSISGAISGAKTKYYPVEYSEVLKFVKDTPGRYAIIGLPSFIMELRLLGNIDPVIKNRIKYTIGLVCGHQKSTKFAEFLAWQCGIKPGHLKKIDFRKKLDNYPSSQYAIEITGDIDGEDITMTKKMSELIGHDWGQGLFKVRASDFTDDVMNETADITLGDAWLPEYTSDSKGNNIIVVRNTDLKEIIESGIQNGLVDLKKVDVETIFRSQAAHYRHTRKELVYRLYKKKKNKVWYPKKREKPSNNISWIRRRIQDKREEICTITPMMYLSAVKNNNINEFIRKINKLDKSYKFLYKIKNYKNKFYKLLQMNKREENK